jgi:exodeoxyribonuclease VII small subunit
MPPSEEDHADLQSPVPSEHAAAGQPSFEQSLAVLEQVVRDLEEGQLDLAEALARYEEGIRHLKHCYRILEQAEQRVELLTSIAPDGTPLAQPFDEAQTPPEQPVTRRRRARRE